MVNKKVPFEFTVDGPDEFTDCSSIGLIDGPQSFNRNYLKWDVHGSI